MSALARARVTVDLGKIAENARAVVSALPGVDVVGVTKVVCGSPEVARAMLAGGVSALGESRLENAERLRAAGIDAPIWLLRAPTAAVAHEAVRLTDVGLVSDIACVSALSAAAVEEHTRYRLVAMVDVGDLREGMPPAELPVFLQAAEALEGVEVIGVGASLTCYGAILPDRENLGMLLRLAEEGSRQLGRPLIVSGGSSTSIDPVVSGHAGAGVDNLRIGEAIVLGVDPATRRPIPGVELHTDALTLAAPVIECFVKPSVPTGTCAQDAFGGCPSFEDRGMRRRAICAVGRQDAPPTGLAPLDGRIEVLGASSDHLVLDVDAVDPPLVFDDRVAFVPNYAATLALFTSAYVEKTYVGG